ncbi:MAG: TlpA disulfide reductase family protein [Planctomycetota bacterium]|nr:TlpA disulfide reductase family protein [Planctomycetota bacterium]
MPALDCSDLFGKRLSLSESPGKVVVLTFWATWCGPCVRKFPEERELVSQMKGRPFELIGVNSDHSLGAAQREVREGRVTWRSFWDGPGRGPIARKLGVDSWPTTFVVDTKGVIRVVNPKDLPSICETMVEEIKRGEGYGAK